MMTLTETSPLEVNNTDIVGNGSSHHDVHKTESDRNNQNFSKAAEKDAHDSDDDDGTKPSLSGNDSSAGINTSNSRYRESGQPSLSDSQLKLVPPWKAEKDLHFPLPRNTQSKVTKGGERVRMAENSSEKSSKAPLNTYKQVWEKSKESFNRKAIFRQHRDKQVEDIFHSAICRNKVDIANDTSITGMYSSKKYVPYGFEPSTNSACEEENYPIIKIKMTISESKPEPEKAQALSPLSYYQSWDPITMKYEPKLKGTSSSNPNGNRSAFPLGAAAAGTRAALLSFMGSRAPGGAASYYPGMSNTNGSNSIPAAIHSNNHTIGGGLGGYSDSQQSSSPIPEKVVLKMGQNDSNIMGGKKIENVWKKKLVQRADNSRKRKSIDDDDDDTYEGSKSLDSKSESSSFRRSKRKRTSKKIYDS